MAAADAAGHAEHDNDQPDVAALIPLVRRIVAARVPDQATADDLVQETLARVLAASGRLEPGMLEPYAIVTARNVVTSMWRERDRHRRNQHRVIDLRPPEAPDEDVLAEEDRAAMAQAMSRLSEREREILLAHEVAGQDTRSLAAELGSTAGAVAAQLNRSRARLRVEYLLAARAGRATHRAVPPRPARPLRRRPPPAARRRRGPPPARVRGVRAAERTADGQGTDEGRRGARPRPQGRGRGRRAAGGT